MLPYAPLSYMLPYSPAIISQGHFVDVADNGAEALQILIDEEGMSMKHYDVVLLDLQMPVMDGFETAKRLRLHEKTMVRDRRERMEHNFELDHEESLPLLPPLFIVGCSANSDDATVLVALSVGMNDFISKPLSLKGFHAIVRKHEGTIMMHCPLKDQQTRVGSSQEL